jgi:hypothetical protein
MTLRGAPVIVRFLLATLSELLTIQVLPVPAPLKFLSIAVGGEPARVTPEICSPIATVPELTEPTVKTP